MHPAGPAAPSTVELLERAIGYTRTGLQLVTKAGMGNPTPCSGWTLDALLRHMNDSFAALEEAADVGHVAPYPNGWPASTDIVATLRTRACALLGGWARGDGVTVMSVGERPISAGVLVATGALEIAVHGWDVARACGEPRPLPRALAEELLELAPLLATADDRPRRFAAPVDVAPAAPASDRLLAFLGRSPYR